MIISRCVLPLLLTGIFFGSAGCGGGVAVTNPKQIEASLDETDSRFSDGSLSDFFIATASRTGRAQVEMESAFFDSYVIVSARNTDGEIENLIEDDDSGGGQNAKVIFDVKKGETYFIAAIDDSASLAPGAYRIIFSDILKDVRVNPDSLVPVP